jgi:cytochrome c
LHRADRSGHNADVDRGTRDDHGGSLDRHKTASSCPRFDVKAVAFAPTSNFRFHGGSLGAVRLARTSSPAHVAARRHSFDEETRRAIMSRLVVLCTLAVLLPAGAWAQQPLPAGDAAKGAQTFKTCGICHNIGPNAKIKIGPPLNGVVGRKAASWPGFSYSTGLQKLGKEGKVWNDAALNTWLTNPRKDVPGTKMIFAGLSNPQQRANVIAYLKQYDIKGNKK